MPDIFVGRLGNIVISDDVTRLDFMRVDEIDVKNKQAQMAPSVRLAIPVTGPVQAIDMLDKVRVQLVRQALAGTAPTRHSETTNSSVLTTSHSGLPDA